jgi:AraC-like DNA-binding protein
MLNDSFKLKFKTMQLMCTDENKNVELHNHPEFEILLFTEGNPEVVVNDHVYHVKPNDMIFINPLDIHSVKTVNDPYSLKCLCFHLSLIPDPTIQERCSGDEVQIQPYLDSSRYDLTYLRERFLRISEEYARSDEWSEAEILSQLVLMFIYLFRNKYISPKGPSTRSSVFCARALEYIAAHYSEDISSFDAAKALAFSQCYFCRIFKAEVGQSFSEYLTMYRISMAKILLEEKNCTVWDAACACGFSSANYFSKCFKRITGTLPSEYKRTLQERKL